MPAVASESLSSLIEAPSYDITTSCSAPRRLMSAREPGELISSSPLISTVSVPYSLKSSAFSSATVCRITATPCLSSAMPRP